MCGVMKIAKFEILFYKKVFFYSVHGKYDLAFPSWPFPSANETLLAADKIT